jgi:hypothetical protein
MGHVMDEQHSSTVLREGSFLSGQQSCMCSTEDMYNTSTVFTLTAAPLPVGSMATDKAINRIRMVRPMCMGLPYASKVADFRALQSNDDFARVRQRSVRPRSRKATLRGRSNACWRELPVLPSEELCGVRGMMPARSRMLTKVCWWPTASDIATQANVGFGSTCGSDRRALKTSKMNQGGQSQYRRAGSRGIPSPVPSGGPVLNVRLISLPDRAQRRRAPRSSRPANPDR